MIIFIFFMKKTEVYIPITIKIETYSISIPEITVRDVDYNIIETN